ncbi:Molybdenum cofactor sulfurase [Nymphon striatum]|nr:Molybdenum cofactor sulfurase [Nymphon striatum]
MAVTKTLFFGGNHDVTPTDLVEKWPLCDRGLSFDRQWMVVGPNGVPLNLKLEPRLCAIKVSVDLKKSELCFKHESSPHFVAVNVNYSVGGSHIEMVPARRQNSVNKEPKREQGANWFCPQKGALSIATCIDFVTRINGGDGRWRPVCIWRSGKKFWDFWEGPGAKFFTKGPKKSNQLSNHLSQRMVTELKVLDPTISLGWLKTKLIENNSGEDLLEDEHLLRRFRSNFIIDGNLSPFEEEKWNSFILKPCSRCQVIGVNEKYQDKEEEPLRTLAFERGQFNCCPQCIFDQCLCKLEICSMAFKIRIHHCKVWQGDSAQASRSSVLLCCKGNPKYMYTDNKVYTLVDRSTRGLVEEQNERRRPT